MRLLFLLLSCFAFPAYGQYSDSISVNFFLLDECIVTINMTSEINSIVEEYASDSLHFIAYFPNFSSKPDKIKSFKDKFNLALDHKTDYFKGKAKHYGATVCPEVVVYDERKKVVLYKGRINNLYGRVGKRRRHATHHDLRLVLGKIRQGEEILETETEAIGCFINFSELNPQ